MASGLIAVIGGFTVILAGSSLVYYDARRSNLDSPSLWAGVVFATGGVGLLTHLLVPTVPIPGLLVIVLAGPALYVFERDDARYGDEPAGPHTLADGSDRSRQSQDASNRPRTGRTESEPESDGR